MDYKACRPVFSLYQDIIDTDGQPLINCRKTFLAERDPTGYRWAIKYLGEYAHWRTLCKNEWFKTALGQWQDELDTLLKSEALEKIAQIAQGASNSSFQAAKYLAGLEHRRPSSGRGRPSKEEITGELHRQAREQISTDEDFARVFGPGPSEGTAN